MSALFVSVLLLTRAMLECYADDHEYRLIRNLLRNYDPRLRPLMNASHALNVTLGVALSQIIDVDEKNQIITTNCWLNQVWMDHNLQWDPEKYGGLRVIRLPYDSVWRPDILLYNNADVSSHKSSISTNVIVTSNGNVTWLSMVIFRSSCAINVKYFPFDEQNCTMKFASWTYDGYQLNLEKVGEDGDTSNYIPNTEWALVNLHVKRNVVFYSCCAEPYPDITYTVQMRRKPLFYVFNMIMPCFIITLISLLGFYIPSNSGEKVSMGITTLLSMTVFLMLVAENMPPTSDVLPLVGMYYGITIIIVSLATAMTVFTLNIHHKGEHGVPVPRLVQKICLDRYLARVLCLREYNVGGQQAEPAIANNKNCSYTRMNESQRHLNTYTMEQPATASVVSPSADNHDSQTRTRRDVAESVEDIVLQDLHTDTSVQSSNSELRHTLPTASFHSGLLVRGNGETGTGNRLRHYVTSAGSSCGCDTGQLERRLVRTLSRICETLELRERRQQHEDLCNTNRVAWQQVSLVADRLLLLIFIVGTVAVTLGILLHAPLSYSFIFGDPYNGVIGADAATDHRR